MRRSVLCVVAALLALPAPSGAQTTRDPLLDLQWGLEQIDAPGAWATTRGGGAVIAVLDSGVAVSHPDLAANVAGRGYDAIRRQPGPGRPSEHGTWVAGIAAAVGDNGRGISGVAPQARILPVRVCDDVCPPAAVARGIRYALRRGADVINMSFFVAKLDEGLGPVLDALEDARDAGVFVVAAAGNSNEPYCAEPAASTICVGATGPDDALTTYSNYDAAMQSAYLVAPGGSTGADCTTRIVSTSLRIPHGCPVGGAYSYSTGTSGAAPFVSGVAALLASIGATGDEIEGCILSTTDDLGAPGRDPVFGFGRVDAARAVACAGG